MPQEKLAKQWLLDTFTRNRLRDPPRTRWRDCISDLGWPRFGVEFGELSEVVENRDAFVNFYGVATARLS